MNFSALEGKSVSAPLVVRVSDKSWMVKWQDSDHFNDIYLILWLTVTGYLNVKWPRMCSGCRDHYLVISPFMTYHWHVPLIKTIGKKLQFLIRDTCYYFHQVCVDFLDR
jgi:hypothetical protein